MRPPALILTALLLLCGSIHAQVKWHTIEEASSATIGNRLYFVDFYTSWCGYCKKMDRTTFTDPTVALILNRYYYPVKFNAEGNNTFTWQGRTFTPSTSTSRTHTFASSLRGYPTYVIFLPNGNRLQTIPGYFPPSDFIPLLWYFASGDYRRYDYDRYLQIFDTDIRPQMQKQLK